MSTRGKRKSKVSAAERQALARARDFAAVGLQEGAAVLAANADVQVRRTGPKAVDSARRLDAFDALRVGMQPGAFDAARRLERDMRIRRGEHDRGAPVGRIDREPSKGRVDAMLEAAERVDLVLGRIGARDAWLLSELIAPGCERGWREGVAYVTGEANPHAQCAVVRSACENLRLAYQALDGVSAAPQRIMLWKQPAA